MKTAKEFTTGFLAEFSTMQLATMAGEQPWVCTVRFIADDEQNLYWASLPSRRHSQEIKDHAQVAGAVVVQNVIGTPVIGIQIEGNAEMLTLPLDNRNIVERYAAKFKRDSDWVEDFLAGKTEHRLYKLTPAAIYLFDEEHFPGGERQKVL